jgi:hypothetical protein
MAVLGHPETENPKSMTQLDATRPLRTCIIGICKDMMSGMDPLREAGLQDEVAVISLVTRKFSSSIFLLENTTQISGGRDQEQVMASNRWCFWLSLSPTFYSRVGLHWRTTRDAIVAAITGAIITYSPCTLLLRVSLSRLSGTFEGAYNRHIIKFY